MTMPHPKPLNRVTPPTLLIALAALLQPTLYAGADQSPDRPTANAEGSRALRITLVDPGEAPRAPLRRSFTPGRTGSFQLEMVSELHQKANDLELPSQPMPQSRIELHTKVLRTNEDGSASVRFTVADASIVGGTENADGEPTGIDPALADAARRDLGAIQGTEITYAVSPRGVISNPGVILKREEPLGRSADLQLQQLQRTLEQIVVPLPEEPVGLGARWRVSTPIDLGGISATRSIEYQLLEQHEGGRLELSFSITVTAPEQRLTNINIPAGAELHLTELAGTGDGVGLLETTAAVATRVTWRVAVNRKHLYRIPIAGQRTPREDRLDFLSISATTVTRLPGPTATPE